VGENLDPKRYPIRGYTKTKHPVNIEITRCLLQSVGESNYFFITLFHHLVERRYQGIFRENNFMNR
jgi:hypothetical protein